MKNAVLVCIGLVLFVCFYIIAAQASAGKLWAFIVLILFGIFGWLINKKDKK